MIPDTRVKQSRFNTILTIVVHQRAFLLVNNNNIYTLLLYGKHNYNFTSFCAVFTFDTVLIYSYKEYYRVQFLYFVIIVLTNVPCKFITIKTKDCEHNINVRAK